MQDWLSTHIRGLGVQAFVQIAAAYVPEKSGSVLDADLANAVLRVLKHPVLDLMICTTLPEAAAIFVAKRTERVPSAPEVRTEVDLLCIHLHDMVLLMLKRAAKLDGKTSNSKHAASFATAHALRDDKPLAQFLWHATFDIATAAVRHGALFETEFAR